MTNQIISREEAINQGLTHYFTGEPCKHGHVEPRFVSSTICIQCSRISASKYQRRRVDADPNFYKRQNLQIKYGLSLEDFRKMEQEHEGNCATCGESYGKHPKVDHCHETGRIRGLLCNSCNVALGHIKDNLGTLARMIDYLKR